MFFAGAPQWSMLGQLLHVVIFILMIYPNAVIPFIFADDTKCPWSTEDIKKLQIDINNASNWSTTLDLLFKESAKFLFLF